MIGDTSVDTYHFFFAKGKLEMTIEVNDLAKKLAEVAKETTPDSGKYSVTMKENMGLMEECGVTEASIRAVGNAQSAVLEAANIVLGDKLVERIEAAKKAGDDPSELQTSLRLPTVGGSLNVRLQAQRVSNDPQNPGKQVTTYGRSGVRLRVSPSMGKETQEKTAKRVEQALKK